MTIVLKYKSLHTVRYVIQLIKYGGIMNKIDSLYKVCPECLDSFLPHNSLAKFCSTHCYGKAKKKQHDYDLVLSNFPL